MFNLNKKQKTMKINKLFLGLFISSAALTSCDLNTTNYGALDSNDAIANVADCRAFMNGIYQHMRSKTGGNYLSYPEMQMDQFVGLIVNGNRLGEVSAKRFTTSDSDMTNLFYNCYILINDVNFFEPNINKILEDETLSESDRYEINYYLGSAKFCRAYAYWYMFDKYVRYDAANVETPALGLPLQKVYNPTGNRVSYPGRSSIKETVDYINGELTDAYNLVKAYEDNVTDLYAGPNASFVNSYAIQALQARMALQTQDYTTALSKAEEVINSGVFELASGEDYQNMWINDESLELILVPFADKTSGGQSTGPAWYTTNQENTSDYIPTTDVILAYENGDIRFDSFFTLYQIVANGSNYYAYAFTKFPGNPALNAKDGVNSMLNKGKPFRLSELYLIAAEAAATDGPAKNEPKANEYLNTLRGARIDGYTDVTLSGSALLNAVKEERGKELIGEGFRLGDLRRWKQGFTREAGFGIFAGTSLAPLAAIMEVVTPTSDNVTYSSDDYRYLWPIPLREMQTNPQLEGQQNKGYEN